MSKLLAGIKLYFRNNSNEQIKKDWADTEKSDDISPTISDFLEQSKYHIIKKGTKSIEEKAKEYVDNLLNGKLNDTPLLYKAVFDNYINIFQIGYNSRDEEVNQLEICLRKFIDMCSSPCVIDKEGFNDELNDLIMRSKLLLKGGSK